MGLFILVIACVNFINLSTAQRCAKPRSGRAEDVRCATGQLVFSTLVRPSCSHWWLGCFGAAEWLCTSMGQFWKRTQGHEPGRVMGCDRDLWCCWLGHRLVVRIVSGTSVLSRFNPVQALKKPPSNHQFRCFAAQVAGGVSPFIAQVLIISTLVVASQAFVFETNRWDLSKAVVNVSMPENKPELLSRSVTGWRLTLPSAMYRFRWAHRLPTISWH